jgi:Uma2 family endonuclease
MEVVSEGSVEIDYVKKRALYARTGAQEYWIIDWQRQLVEV